MDRLDEGLRILEERIAEAERQYRAVREENERLKAALGERDGWDPARSGRPESRPLRLIVLESERASIRSRIQNLLEGL